MDFCTGDATVLLGHDSRASSESLVNAASQGIVSVGGNVDFRGLLTTPQLHWMVREQNAGRPNTLADYYRILSAAYNELASTSSQGMQVCLWIMLSMQAQ